MKKTNLSKDVRLSKAILEKAGYKVSLKEAEKTHEVDPEFHEGLQRYVGKPLKELLTVIDGKLKIDIRTDRPTHYGTHGYNGRVNEVTWTYADLIINSVAAGTGYLVDLYVKLDVDVPEARSEYDRDYMAESRNNKRTTSKSRESRVNENWRDGRFGDREMTEYTDHIMKDIKRVKFSLDGMEDKHPEYRDKFQTIRSNIKRMFQ